MALQNDSSLPRAIRDCLEKIDYSKSLAEPIIAQVENGELESDYLEKINKFLSSFAEVQASIEAMPIEDGKIMVELSPPEKRQTGELLPELIAEVEILAKYQAIIIETLRNRISRSGKDLKGIRDAKKIFEKFIKKQEKGPKFFDRKG